MYIYIYKYISNLISKRSCDMCYRKDINTPCSCFSQNSYLLECVIWIDLL